MNRGALDLAQSVDKPQTLINPRLWRGGEMSRRLGMARSNIPRQDGPILGISGFSPRPGYPSGGLFHSGEWEGITETGALWGGGSGGGSDNVDFTFAILDDDTGSWFFYASYSGEIEEITNIGSGSACQPIFIGGSWYVFDGTEDIVRLDMDGSQTVVANTDNGGSVLIPECMCYDGTKFAILANAFVYTQTGYNTWTQTYSSAAAGFGIFPSLRGLTGTTNGLRMGWIEHGFPTWRHGECGADGAVTATVLTSDPSAYAYDAMPGSAIFATGTDPRIFTSTGSGETWMMTGGPASGVSATVQTEIGEDLVTMLGDYTLGARTTFRVSSGGISIEGVDVTSDRLSLGVACGSVSSVYCIYYNNASSGYFITRNSEIILDIANDTGINVTDSPTTLIVAEL